MQGKHRERRTMPKRQYNRGDVAPGVLFLRKRAGLTQEELARQSGVGVATIRRIELGRKANTATLNTLAKYFGVEYHVLLKKPSDL